MSDTTPGPAEPSGPTCRECGSPQVQAVSTGGKSYSSGCGLLGCLLIGPLGLLFGLLGHTPNELKVVCLSCGHAFVPPGLHRRQWLTTLGGLGLLSLVLIVVGVSFLSWLGGRPDSYLPDNQPAGPVTRRSGPTPSSPAEPAPPPGPFAAKPAAPAAPSTQLQPTEPEPLPLPRKAVASLAEGMDTPDVVAAFGEPARRTRAGARDRAMEWWEYPDGSRLTFYNGQLLRWKVPNE